jgi:hypothetical protein
MAKVHNNIFVRGLTGSVGDQFVIRKTRSGKTIVANKPMFDENREFSEDQKTQQDAFRKATTYGKSAKRHPLYVQLARGTGMTGYNIAVADWFNAPEVLEIDTSGWNGEIGQTIRIAAQDDVQVVSVVVTIQDAEENILEQGAAVQWQGIWWDYTTTTQVRLSTEIRVTAEVKDLPGNSNDMIWSMN